MVVAPTLLLNTRKLESPDACCRAACTSAAPLKSQEPAPDCADAHASRHAYPIASIKRADALSLPRRGSVVGRTRSHMVAPCCDACRWQGVARVFSSKPARYCVLLKARVDRAANYIVRRPAFKPTCRRRLRLGSAETRSPGRTERPYTGVLPIRAFAFACTGCGNRKALLLGVAFVLQLQCATTS